MRLWIWLTFLFLTALALSDAGQARVSTPCPAFGYPCECSWHERDCLPTCHIQPQIECGPT
jgi:hypothetical protein